ncbi:MAG TPA: site-specific DNA-methyltransferase [Pyrinomonadaceae bacterium]|nr:site-specific DNA-methyltransferase [Pyrinomonadaceae bacterium]
MEHLWERIDSEPLEKLRVLCSESKSVIVISTFFDPLDKLDKASPANYQLTGTSIDLIKQCKRVLRIGGLLFVYGLPHHLSLIGQHLSYLRDNKTQMLFKYWITLDLDDTPRNSTLAPTNLGVLMFLKSKSNNRIPVPFHLNTSTVRVPHTYCSACGQNVKDWGGKKHLMNPNGIALSDVWRDLERVKVQDHIIHATVLERIYALTKHDNASYLHIVQDEPSIMIESSSEESSLDTTLLTASNEWKGLTTLELNKVYQGDCISFLERVSTLYPRELFDLVFADPPYNLKKGYDQYEDALAEQHYIEWCNRWLDGMARTLKPGGSLFVLNLPKWAIHHAAYLNRHLEFRHWITWDALSDPRGKLMPAHYALLYYTKPGASPVFKYSNDRGIKSDQCVMPPDSSEYCLRASCVKKRKRLGDDKRDELSDVWFGIHRIKHKRDRDAHPCQLPEKLMERIILLTTNRGELVFDPFCGAGTTALAARKLDRNFITIDLDPNYVRITQEKLVAMEQFTDMFGIPKIPRRSIKKNKAAASKKEIETYLQRLAQRLGKEPSEQDIEADDIEMLRKIDLIYPTRLAAIKRCRVILRT